LVYLKDGPPQVVTIPWLLDVPTMVGSDPGQAQSVIVGDGVLPRHATIIKLPESPTYVLLDHAAPQAVTEVNKVRVLRFKVVRHGDVITFGQQQFVFLEFQVSKVPEGSSQVFDKCAVLRHGFAVGDDVVMCRCGQFTHLACWLVAERCPGPDCAYPHRNLLVKFFQDTFLFAALTASSPLVGRKCALSGSFPWNEKEFAPSETQIGRVVHCPMCKIPYHEPCWFSLDVCVTPDCGYNVREKVLSFFSHSRLLERTNGH
jgi:hypothetical protein